jgi:hypothetical protein
MKHIKLYEEWKDVNKFSSKTLNESSPTYLMDYIMVELERRNILFDHWKTGEVFAKSLENVLHKIFQDRELRNLKKTIIKDKALMSRITNIFIAKIKEAKRLLSKKGIVRPKEMDLQIIMKYGLDDIIDEIKVLVNNI